MKVVNMVSFVMRSGGVTWFFLPVVWALACGGRYSREEGDVAAAGASANGAAGQGAAGGSFSSGGSGAGSAPAVGGGCACDPIDCPFGYKPVSKAGACCPQCELDLGLCAELRKQYIDYRARVIVDQWTPCRIDDDCGVFLDRTGCAPSCEVVIPNAARRGIDDRLYAFAETSCNPECPPDPLVPCPPHGPPSCVAGRCQ